MRRNCLLYLVCTLTMLFAFGAPRCLAQAPDIVWEKSLGGTNYDEAERVLQTRDGGFILLGWTYSNDGDVTGNHSDNNSDCWVAKLDPLGNIVWSRSLGGSNWDVGLEIRETNDGGYIVSGHTYSDDGDIQKPLFGSSEALICKLDAVGNIQWFKTYGGSGEDVFLSIE